MDNNFIELEFFFQKLYLLRIEIDRRKPSTQKLQKKNPDYFESAFYLFF